MMTDTTMIIDDEQQKGLMDAQGQDEMVIVLRGMAAQMMAGMQAMSDMLRSTHESMVALERQVRQMEKVTPAQARAINTAIRGRAVELCKVHHADGCERAAASAIRRAVKLSTGVTAMKDIPRCDYMVIMRLIEMWDDYKVMKAIKAKGKEV